MNVTLAVPLAHAAAIIWLSICISQGRASLTEEKEVFAHEHEEMKNLEAIVQKIKPTALIGVAAIGGAFTEQILKDMAAFNERPIIFALSNPTSKAECSAEQCYKVTKVSSPGWVIQEAWAAPVLITPWPQPYSLPSEPKDTGRLFFRGDSTFSSSGNKPTL